MRFGFARVDEWIAECLRAESSSFNSTAFYMQAFALPRFIPTEHLYFNYGFRIGGRWDGISSELVTAIRGSLARLSNIASFDGLLGAATQPDVNARHAEVRLCVGLLTNDMALFKNMSEQILSWKVKLAWEPDVLGRCHDLIIAVDHEGPSRGVAILESRRTGIDALLA
jgi:hypothetical protein